MDGDKHNHRKMSKTMHHHPQGSLVTLPVFANGQKEIIGNKVVVVNDDGNTKALILDDDDDSRPNEGCDGCQRERSSDAI